MDLVSRLSFAYRRLLQLKGARVLSSLRVVGARANLGFSKASSRRYGSISINFIRVHLSLGCGY